LKEKKDINNVLMNERIRAPQVQLITQDGENVGIVSREEALKSAERAGLDLVLLSPQGNEGVPVVKVMDFGKALYEKKKKQAEAKKHQKVIQVKEIKIRPKIGEHDYLTKMKQAIQFLEDGKHVKFTLVFRGREAVLREERGAELFNKIQQSFDQAGLSKNLAQEKDTKMGQLWSRIYYLKHK